MAVVIAAAVGHRARGFGDGIGDIEGGGRGERDFVQYWVVVLWIGGADGIVCLRHNATFFSVESAKHSIEKFLNREIFEPRNNWTAEETSNRTSVFGLIIYY